MKICVTCKLEKDDSVFRPQRRSCRDCMSAYQKVFRATKIDQVRAITRAQTAKTRKKNRAFLNQIKNVPCADCHNTFPPVCMDFDHARGEKKFQISMRVSGSLDSILEEIKKCDVVCSNCHRIRTQERRVANG